MGYICAIISALVIGILVCFTADIHALQSCGTTLTNENGTLQSFNYPFTLQPHDVCNWTFNVNTTELILLNVEECKLQNGDIMDIFDGYKKWTYNNTNNLESFLMVLSPNSTINISVDDKSDLPRRFMASYTTDLADNVMYSVESGGWIKSPHFSKRNDNLVYSWIITQKPGTGIYLSFKAFNISEGTLTVEIGTDVQIFSGAELPNDIVTSNTNVKLTLNMSMNNNADGFEAHYSQHYPACSRIESIKNSTNLTINFDEPVINHPVRCIVIVEGPTHSVLSAAIQHSLGEGESDVNTMIELNDGGSMYSRNLLVYSPTSELEAPPGVLTSSNRLWLRYMSVPPGKKSVNIKAFITVHNSGKSLFDNGTFELPEEPGNTTLNSSTSAFLLSVKSGEQIVTKINPNATLSNISSILFYDGANTEVLLANFTKDDKLHEVISTSSQMFIVAQNFEGNETFSASFSGYARGSYLLSSKRLGSYQVNNIEGNSSYLWIISPLNTSSSEVIALTLGTVRLPSTVRLMIYESSSPSASDLLFNLSGSVINQVIYTSASNGVRFVLENEDNNSDIIVDASYVIKSDCHQQINMTSENITITSPSYPRLYPANANCSWMIFSSKTMLLTVKELNIPSSQPVLVYGVNNGSMQLLANISGDRRPDDIIIANDSAVLILFSSLSSPNNVTVSTGFKIILHSLDCGGVLNGTIKEFQTPGYPKPVTKPTYCVWSITLPEEKGNVEIINLAYITGGEKSTTSYIKFHEGGSLQSQTTNMSAVNSTGFLSKFNQLLIEYKSVPDINTDAPSYKFTYDAYVCSPDNLCKNGICLHDGWRCNGVNDCGDFTDEQFCGQTTIVNASTGVSVTTFVVVMFLMLFIGIGIAIGGPKLWRRIRSHNSYQEFRNTAEA